MLVRFAEPADRPFIVQMACLASTLEDSPLPADDDPTVLELLPQSSDVALVAINDQGQASGAAWWHFANTPLVRGADGIAVPELVLTVLVSDRGRAREDVCSLWQNRARKEVSVAVRRLQRPTASASSSDPREEG